jgi:hypothetical protein
MIRTLGGIVAGMAAAIAIIMMAESIGYQIAGPSASVVTGDALTAPTVSVPLMLFSAAGWLLGGAAGSFVAVAVSEQRWTAWAVTGAVIAANLFNFALMAFPLWVMAAGIGLPLAGAWLSQRLVSVRAARRERRQLSE